MKQNDRDFIGVVKTSHALFPKEYLEMSTLAPMGAGSRLCLTATVDGVDLIDVGYNYASTTGGRFYVSSLPKVSNSLLHQNLLACVY